MKINFKTILVSALTAITIISGALFYFANYMSFGDLALFTIRKPVSYGNVSLTDLQDSDTMSDFPTLYNANNLILNNGKIDVSTTTLPLLTTLLNLTSVGTITTGTWHGTLLESAYGGTASSSLALNQVLLGNAASGFKVVSGYGTAGQFLTSNGSGNVPYWSTGALDYSDDYTWTGAMYLTGSTTIAASNLTTATLNLNGINYAFPSSQTSSSTILATNGAGTLAWIQQGWELVATPTLSSPASSITANVPVKSNYKILVDIASTTAVDTLRLTFNGDNTANYTWRQSDNSVNGSGANQNYMLLTDGNLSTAFAEVTVYNYTTRRKIATWIVGEDNGVGSAPDLITGTGIWGNVANSISSITVSSSGNNFYAGSQLVIYGK